MGSKNTTLTRVLTALVVLPVLLVVIGVPALRPCFGLVVAAFAWIGMREYVALLRAREIAPNAATATVAGALLPFAAVWASPATVNALLFAGAMAVCIAHVLRGRLSIAALAASVFGVFYVGWFAAHAVLVHRAIEHGPGLVFFLIVVIAISDTGAYFVGRHLGRTKLAPRLSPKKTWEGAAGGTAASVMAGGVFYLMADPGGWEALPGWGFSRWVLTAGLLCVLGQFGDLTESALKRDADVKDAGQLFPGHGGMLDRCDGYLFAAPALYYLASLG